MAISKVLLNDDLQIDLTDKTVSDENLQYGFTAHKADGQQVIGEADSIGELEKVFCDGSSSHNVSMASGQSATGGVYTFMPTQLSWNYNLTLQGLTFQYYEAKHLKVQLEFDYVITGLVQDGYLASAVCVFNSANPTGSTSRDSARAISTIGNNETGSLSGHVNTGPVPIIPQTDGTPVDNYWVGLRMYPYTGAGSTVQISNIKFGFYMPVEDAIITRHFSGVYSNSEITIIRNGAFYSCTNLTGIDAPNVSIVGGYAFCYTKISDISLPSMTSSVPEAMCTGCSTFPSFENSAVTVIGSSAFQNCTSLSSVSFANVTFVSSQAFQGCTSLTDIYFPKLADCGSSAFQSTAIDRVDNTDNFPSLSHTGTYGFQGTPVSYISISKFNSINNYAFNNCKQLSSVHAPNVTTIWGFGLASCTALSEIYLPKLSSLGGTAFGNAGLQKLTLYGYLSSNTTNNFISNKSLSVAVARVYTNITGGGMFSSCTALTAYDGYGRFAGNDFNGCTNLSTIVLRNLTTATLASTTAFNNTPFASGKTGGTIYIPSDHYDALGTGSSLDYKSATNWSVVDGWGTITWANIYGSPYESKYADGTDFPWIAYVNSDGTPKDNTWDYEWDYTDGLLSANGWTKWVSGTASESLVSDGVKLTSNSSGEIRMYKSDWTTHKKALMEVTLYFSSLNSGTINNRVSLGNSDGYTVTFFPCNAYWRPQNHTTASSCLSTVSATANTTYTLRLLLIDGVGFVWVNNALIAYPVSPGTMVTKFSYPLVNSQKQNNGYGIFQSIKLKAWDD